MPSESPAEPSPLLAARIAGGLWLIVILTSVVAVIAGTSLSLSGDQTTMAANALAAAPKIRLTFILFFFGKVCYLGVTVLLYELLRPVNKSIALFSAFCGLAGLLTGGAGHYSLLTALSLLEESRRAAEPLASQLAGSAKMLLASAPRFSGEDVWFGFQILSVGYLTVCSYFLPRTIGVLLLLGGACFLITSVTNFVMPSVGERVGSLLLPVVLLGEGALALWLFFKGVNVERWRSAKARAVTIDPAVR
jgi:hypothetical protein